MKTSIYGTTPPTVFIRGIVLLTMFCSCMIFVQCSNAQSKSILIGKTSQSFTINSNKSAHQIKIKPADHLKYHSEKKVWLLFNEPDVKQNPEGIYELYVSFDPLDTEQLNAENVNFVNVLDVYSTTK